MNSAFRLPSVNATAAGLVLLLAGLVGMAGRGLTAPAPQDARMEYSTYELKDLQDERGSKTWHEFLRTESLYTGLYVLKAGSRDGQQPHAHDEVYYVLEGRGQIALGKDQESRPVQPGSVVFVAAEQPHHFHDITEDLHLLVFFATGAGKAE